MEETLNGNSELSVSVASTEHRQTDNPSDENIFPNLARSTTPLEVESSYHVECFSEDAEVARSHGDCLIRTEEKDDVCDSKNLKRKNAPSPVLNSFGTESLSQHGYSNSDLLTVHMPENIVVEDTDEIAGNPVEKNQLEYSNEGLISSSCEDSEKKSNSLERLAKDYAEMAQPENALPDLLLSSMHCNAQKVEHSDDIIKDELKQGDFIRTDSGDKPDKEFSENKKLAMEDNRLNSSLLVSVETMVKENELQSFCIAQRIHCGKANLTSNTHNSPLITCDKAATKEILTESNQTALHSRAMEKEAKNDNGLSVKEAITPKSLESSNIIENTFECVKMTELTESVESCKDKQTSEAFKSANSSAANREKLKDLGHAEALSECPLPKPPNAHLCLNIKYRDANDEWSCDSESDSDMSSSSSSSLSDNSDVEKGGSTLNRNGNNLAKKDELGKKNVNKTRGEIGLDDLPPLEDLSITVSENEMQQIGTVVSVVNQLVVVQSFRNSSALDLESVLFSSDGTALGQIFDVFGPVVEPLYAVRFNSENEIKAKGITKGSTVYYAPDHTDITSFVFTDKLKSIKGSDASWEHNNEPPEECLDYSDDEEEKKAKQKQRAKRRERPLDIDKIGKEIKEIKSSRKEFSNSQQRWWTNINKSLPEMICVRRSPLLRPPRLHFYSRFPMTNPTYSSPVVPPPPPPVSWSPHMPPPPPPRVPPPTPPPLVPPPTSPYMPPPTPPYMPPPTPPYMPPPTPPYMPPPTPPYMPPPTPSPYISPPTASQSPAFATVPSFQPDSVFGIKPSSFIPPHSPSPVLFSSPRLPPPPPLTKRPVSPFMAQSRFQSNQNPFQTCPPTLPPRPLPAHQKFAMPQHPTPPPRPFTPPLHHTLPPAPRTFTPPSHRAFPPAPPYNSHLFSPPPAPNHSSHHNSHFPSPAPDCYLTSPSPHLGSSLNRHLPVKYSSSNYMYSDRK